LFALNYAVTANHINLLMKDTGGGVIPWSMPPLAKRTATRSISPRPEFGATPMRLTPIQRYSKQWSKNGFLWKHLEQKKKSPPSLNRSRLDVCRKSPTLIITV